MAGLWQVKFSDHMNSDSCPTPLNLTDLRFGYRAGSHKFLSTSIMHSHYPSKLLLDVQRHSETMDSSNNLPTLH